MTLLTALVALVASIGSSIVAYTATQGQSAANERLSSTEFVREQQQVAFSRLLTTIIKIEDVEIELATDPLRPPVDIQKIALDKGRKWLDLDNELAGAIAAVDLVGSDLTRLDATALRSEHMDVWDAYLSLVLASSGPTPDPAKVETARDEVSSARSEATQARHEFISNARLDLGIDQPPG